MSRTAPRPKILYADGAQEAAVLTHAQALLGSADTSIHPFEAGGEDLRESVLFLHQPDEDGLAAGLDAGINALIELGGADQLPTAIDYHCLTLALTTRSAYSMPVSRLFALALLARAGRAGEERMDMELAVHEAYSNGIIHGNLEIGSELRGTLESYDAYAAQLEERLGDTGYGGRYILLQGDVDGDLITVKITDQGPGYELADSNDDEERKHGRGLGIIAAACQGLTVSDGGRTMTMTFSLSEGAV